MSTSVAAVDCVVGKHGYYACSREDFIKLKEAHRLLYQAYRDVKRANRWFAKLEHNRRGSQPVYPEWLNVQSLHCSGRKLWYGMGFAQYGQPVECQLKFSVVRNKLSLYEHILRQYRLARRPYASPHEVPKLDIPKDLDMIVLKLQQFYNL